MRRGKVVKRWYSALQAAAIMIQRAWRDLYRRRRGIYSTSNELPKDLKDLYSLIRRHHTSRGHSCPTYERFVRLVERIQAATEGARVRRRLRSRRLQTIIKEIKEIRALLHEMSEDPGNESSTDLKPQLSGQLHQKLTQLRMALHGPGDAARFLLRRSPATPLVIFKTNPLNNAGLAISKLGDQFTKTLLLESTSHSKSLLSQKLLAEEELGKNTQVEENGSLISSESSHNNQTIDTLQKPSSSQKEVAILAGVAKRGSCVSSESVVKGVSASTGSNQNVLLEPKFEAAMEAEGTDDKTSHEISEKLGYELCSDNVDIQEPMCKSHSGFLEKVQDADTWDHSDRQKHPFLRRKSVAMAPQKLDWSKVKPMVSSRLEPELKHKLFKCRGKEGFRTSYLKKVNYARIKSRLFNYENLIQSPRDSIALSSDCGASRESERQISKTSKLQMAHDGKHIEPADGGYTNNDTVCGQNHQQRVKRASLPSSRGQNEKVIPRKRKGNSSDDEHGQKTTKSGYLNTSGHFKDHDCRNMKPNETQALNGKRNHDHSDRYTGSEVYCKEVEVQPGKRGDAENAFHAGKTHNGHDNNVEVISLAVEEAFREIMALKCAKNISIKGLFESFKGTSTIPRLHPESDIFQGSSLAKRRLHDALLQSGRASKLQSDSLAFISIRD